MTDQVIENKTTIIKGTKFVTPFGSGNKTLKCTTCGFYYKVNEHRDNRTLTAECPRCGSLKSIGLV